MPTESQPEVAHDFPGENAPLAPGEATSEATSEAASEALEPLAIKQDFAPAESEDDFPVLTDIVDPSETTPQTKGFDAEAFAATIEAAVLEMLLVELDRALEQRLGRTISDLLEQVLHGLRAELSVSVRQMVREAVSKSVAKELAERARLA